MTAPPDPTPRITFAAIDILRAVAALLVVVYHVSVLGNWSGVERGEIWLLLNRGWIGVDLFFVISGFVISWAALSTYAQDPTSFRISFARRRFWRIVPLYVLTCAIYLFMVAPTLLQLPLKDVAVHVLSHLLFIHNLHPTTYGSINGVTWSVALEVQFYVLIALVTPWLARTHPQRALLVTAVFALLYRYVTTLIWVPGGASTAVIHQMVAVTQLPGVIDQFACGIFLAVVLHRGHGALARSLRVGWGNFALWAVLATGLLTVALKVHMTYTHWDLPAMVVLWRPLLTLGLTALVAAAIVFPWAEARVLAPLRYLGVISYGIYLWHLLIVHGLTGQAPKIQGYQLLATVVICTLLMASLSWHAFEKPWVLQSRRPKAA
jgi:peptidoglycan/LPS O-acetylase OafA/YrhL